MKKPLLTIILIIILLAAGYFIFNNKQAEAPVTENNTQNITTNPQPQQTATTTTIAPTTTKPTTSPNQTQLEGTFSNGEDAELGVDVLVSQVDYDGSSFSPASLNIKAGDVVIFKNKSQDPVWIASDPHPVHTDYPGFDSKKAIAPGGSYQFKFANAGTWGYHNHLNSSQHGTVIVK